MKFFKNKSKKIKSSRALANTVWICETTRESNATYYLLRFAAVNFVEGWVKYKDQKEEIRAFSAVYSKENNLLKFQKEDDLFVAVYTKEKIAAVIDGQTLNFYRKG